MKRRAAFLFLCSTIFAMAYAVAPAYAGEPINYEPARIWKGFQLAPVPLTYKLENRNLVGLGSYIVNTSGCNDCHTAPSFAEGGNPFNGEPEKINTAVYLAGGQFFGPFVSKNLTPDATGKPAGLTYGEFKTLLRTGHDPDTGQLLQVMPWPAFGKWNDHDMLAVYNYLRAIPPLPNNY
jgi:hypothetical protein